MSGENKLSCENIKIDKMTQEKKSIEKKTTEKIPCEVCEKPYAKSYMKNHIKKEHENKSIIKMETDTESKEVIQVEVEVTREQQVEENNKEEENKEDSDQVIKMYDEDDEELELEMRELQEDYELGEEATKASQDLKEQDKQEKKVVNPDAEFILSTQTGLELEELFNSIDMDNLHDDSRDTNILPEILDNKEADEDVTNIIGEVLKETVERVERENETVHHNYARNEDMTRQCPHCDQKFGWLVDLISHMMKDHEPFKKMDMPADPVPYLFGEMMSELGEEMEGIRHKTEKFQRDITEQLNFQTQTLKQDLLREIGKMLKTKTETGEEQTVNKPTPDIKKNLACYSCKENYGNKEQHFHCLDCGKFFKTGIMLSKHIQNVHTDEIQAVCDTNMCKDSNRIKDEEIKRLKAVIAENSSVLMDTLEENRTLNEQNIILMGLEDEDKSPENDENSKESGDVQSENRKLTCTKCGWKTSNKKLLVGHMTSHQKADNRPQLFKCTECDFTSKSISSLNGHLEAHGNMISCGRNVGNGSVNCTKEFQTTQKLNEHIKNVHSQNANSQFKCNECEKVFSTQNSLLQHARTKHKETSSIPVGHQEWARPQQMTNKLCTMCPAEFKMEADLRVHETIHNEDIPCTQCDAVFETKKQLSYHKRTEHEGFNTVIKLCRYFQQGRCHKGAECSFTHEYKNNMKSQKQQWSQACRRGPRCEFLAMGDCYFFHSEFRGQEQGSGHQEHFRGWKQDQEFKNRNQEQFRRRGQGVQSKAEMHKKSCHFQDRCWNLETCEFSHLGFRMR